MFGQYKMILFGLAAVFIMAMVAGGWITVKGFVEDYKITQQNVGKFSIALDAQKATTTAFKTALVKIEKNQTEFQQVLLDLNARFEVNKKKAVVVQRKFTKHRKTITKAAVRHPKVLERIFNRANIQATEDDNRAGDMSAFANRVRVKRKSSGSGGGSSGAAEGKDKPSTPTG